MVRTSSRNRNIHFPLPPKGLKLPPAVRLPPTGSQASWPSLRISLAVKIQSPTLAKAEPPRYKLAPYFEHPSERPRPACPPYKHTKSLSHRTPCLRDKYSPRGSRSGKATLIYRNRLQSITKSGPEPGWGLGVGVVTVTPVNTWEGSGGKQLKSPGGPGKGRGTPL